MPRTLPRPPAIPAITTAGLKGYQHVVLGPFSFQLLTPLFGGGAVPRICAEADGIVHPLQVRGLLRKWWRATAGAQRCRTPAELRVAEDPIWGNATRGGRVLVHVDSVGTPRALNPGEKRALPQAHNERLFPIPHGDFDRVRQQVGFQLSSWVEPKAGQPPCDKDVFFAMTAFGLFGGIGSRWRRGTGSVHCTKPGLPPVDKAWPMLAAATGVRRPWPHLSVDFPPVFKALGAAANPDSCLAALVNLIEDLRAYRHTGDCSEEFISKRGKERFPSALILRPVVAGGQAFQMALPMAMASDRRDGNGWTYDEALRDAVEFFRERGYK